jgi:glycosyltransferase involved in cell wall biosynthesis
MGARSEPVTIAFMPVGQADWHGGQSLINNAMHALHEVAGAQVRILTVGGNGLWSDGAIPWTAPQRWAPSRAVNWIVVRLSHRNLEFENMLRAAGVDVLVGERLSWRLGTIATASWLQDFQHRHMPQLFDSRELRQRDRVFIATMQVSDRALAMSESVGEDARQFAPEYAHKVRVVKPWSIIDPLIYRRDPHRVVQKYALPERFFYVPNQFWVHKNHSLVFEALRIARERGQDCRVVLTGRPEDYRRPDHFQTVMAQVRDWGLTDQVQYLGIVDRAEVYDFIRQSITVVNPSLFEGWGYTVDEAAAVGKHVLASDLPAHREQAPAACEFFDPLDAEDLARHMGEQWRWAPPGPSRDLEDAARERMPWRLHELGSQLFNALQELVAARTAAKPHRVFEHASA